MRGHDDRTTRRLQFLQKFPYCVPRLRIQAHRGLVQEDDLRLMHQRPRGHEPLLLSARQLVHFGSRARTQVEALQQRVCAPLALRVRMPK